MHVKKAAIFPKDGNFPPYLDQELESIIKDKGGIVSSYLILSLKFELSIAKSISGLG